MSNNKKILLMFHLNFLNNDRGCTSAVYIPVKILKSLGFSIDFFSISKHDNFSDFGKYNKENFIDNLYLDGIKYNYSSGNINKKVKGNGFLVNIKKILKRTYIYKTYIFMRNIFKNIIFNKRKYYSNSFVSDVLLKRFHEIIKSTHYDYIYVHYIHWADLFRYSSIPSNTKLIYNMQDSHFIQQFYFSQINRNDIGKAFMDELNALNYFHRFICISFDEMLFWSKLLPDKIFYFCPPVNPLKEFSNAPKQIDILFLGARNILNIEGICWFLDQVYPFLQKNISITFCGKFLLDLPQRYINRIKEYNITTINFAENIEDLYVRAKIFIVPILKGTGIKIKTIEALSFSIPVVSTVLGVDGFPDKYESGCLVSDNPVEFASNINNLLSNGDFYEAIINKQRKYFNKYFSYEKNIELFKEVFDEKNIER